MTKKILKNTLGNKNCKPCNTNPTLRGVDVVKAKKLSAFKKGQVVRKVKPSIIPFFLGPTIGYTEKEKTYVVDYSYTNIRYEVLAREKIDGERVTFVKCLGKLKKGANPIDKINEALYDGWVLDNHNKENYLIWV